MHAGVSLAWKVVLTSGTIESKEPFRRVEVGHIQLPGEGVGLYNVICQQRVKQHQHIFILQQHIAAGVEITVIAATYRRVSASAGTEAIHFDLPCMFDVQQTTLKSEQQHEID